MRCFNYYAFLVVCILYCRFAICGTSTHDVVSTAESLETPNASENIPDGGEFSDTAESVNLDGKDIKKNKELLGRKTKIALRSVGVVVSLVLIFIIGVFLFFQRRLSQFLETSDDFKVAKLGDLPPVSTEYYGSTETTEPTAIQAKAILEINNLIYEHVKQVATEQVTLDLSSAQAICPLDPAVLESFGNLQLERFIGRVGNAGVYIAKCPKTNKEFKIKVFDRVDEIRLEREILFAKRLTEGKEDPFKIGAETGQSLVLATYYGPIPGVEGEGDRSALIYEGAGIDFMTIINQGELLEKLSMDTRAYIASRVLLSTLHLGKSRNVHNRIKAENVLIDRNGRISLSDYEASQDVYTEAMYDYEILNCEPERFCALMSINPRQLPIDTRSDLFSTGVTLYYIFTGHYPITDDKFELYQHYGRAVMFPENPMPRANLNLLENLNVPPQWIVLLEKLLEIRRADRVTHEQIVQQFSDLLNLQ